MKSKRLSKKVLSVFLAVMMAMSSVVVGAMSASAYSLNQLGTMMTSYTTKMGQGKSYSNMAEAYTAWYNAYTYTNEVNAGVVEETTTKTNSLYNALSTAVTNMKAYTAPTITSKVVTFAGNTSGTTVTPEQYSKNLLYVGSDSGTIDGNARGSTGPIVTYKTGNDGTSGATQTSIFYPTAVMLYDGVTTPSMPVMMDISQADNKAKSRYWHTVYPTDSMDNPESTSNESTSFGMASTWKAGGWEKGTLDWTSCMSSPNSQNTGYNGGVGGNKGDYSIGVDAAISGNNSSYEVYDGAFTDKRGFKYANAITYKGTMASNTYSSATQLIWDVKSDGNKNASNKSDDYGTAKSDATYMTYVVNGKALSDAVTSTTVTDLYKNITSYSYEKAVAFLTAVQNAEKVDVTSYFASVSDVATSVNNCSEAIKTAVETVSNTRTALTTQNLSSYVTLASTVKANAELYAGNNADGSYTDNSFAVFKTAYENAKNELINVADSTAAPYMTDATTLNTNIINAISSLEAGAASFTALDSAVSTLVASLQSNSNYSASSVQAIADTINGLTYYNKTASERAEVKSSVQDAIDAETTTVSALKATALDSSVVDSAKEEAQTKSIDRDAYSIDSIVSALDDFKSNMTTTIQVAGNSVTVLNYASQAALDSAVATVLNTLVLNQYTVTVPSGYTAKVNGTAVTGKVDYGTEVTVESNSETSVGWYMSFTSPTATCGAEYQGSGINYTFNVKGNTVITTAKPGASTTRVVYAATVNGKSYGLDYVASTDSFVLPEAPKYAYNTFVNYTVNGETKAVGDTISAADTVDGSIYVVANYTIDSTAKYLVQIQSVAMEDLENSTHNYNDKVTVNDPSAAAWVLNADDGSLIVLSYGTSYTFYVSEAVSIGAYSSQDLTDYAGDITFGDSNKCNVTSRAAGVITTNLASAGKATFVGQFITPSGVTPLEYGYLIQTTASTTGLTVENASKDNIVRCKASKRTVANQFVITKTGLTAGQKIRYCSYLTYKTSSGTIMTIYSSTEAVTLS